MKVLSRFNSPVAAVHKDVYFLYPVVAKLITKAAAPLKGDLYKL
ncbi:MULTISPECIES: hypothetical protein [Flavobacterium]|nr:MULTISPECIES: hypothetical protein [Flavobacterium]